MKKRILICIHNYFFLDHYILDIQELKKNFEITIIVSNYLIKDCDKFYKDYSEKVKIKNIYIVPFYKKNLDRSSKSIFSTHLYLIKLKKIVSFREFDLCISDNKFFIWQKIILETFLSDSCTQVGVQTGSLPVQITFFEKILKGEDIFQLIPKLHKFRDVKNKIRKKEKNYFKKIKNIKKRLLDIYLDRCFLSYIFHKKIFHYEKYDFNIMETENFDYKIVFHHANYIFWKMIYQKQNKKVFLSKHICACKCDNTKKKKIIFLSSLLWSKDRNKLVEQIECIFEHLKEFKTKSPFITDLYIKHHPMEDDINIKIINKFLKEKFQKLINVFFLDKNLSLKDSACDYSIAFGPVSTVLVDFSNACRNIKVYCLDNLSKDELGEKYYLKLFNERVFFLDKNNYIINHNIDISNNIALDIKKENFPNIINNIISL